MNMQAGAGEDGRVEEHEFIGFELGPRQGFTNMLQAPAVAPIAPEEVPVVILDPTESPRRRRERRASAPSTVRITVKPILVLRKSRSLNDLCETTVEPQQSLVPTQPTTDAESTASNEEVVIPPPSPTRRRRKNCPNFFLPSTSGETKKK